MNSTIKNNNIDAEYFFIEIPFGYPSEISGLRLQAFGLSDCFPDRC